MTVRTEGPEGIPTLGILELSSIAKGLAVCDAMLKKADVRLLRATPAGSGKFIILLTGPEADLFEAVAEGRAVGAPFIVQWAYIPNIHRQVVDALTRKGGAGAALGSLGVLESAFLASALHAADAAAKTSAIRILELVFDLDLGGKMYCTLTGDLADVEAAMEAGERQLRADGAFLHREIVARPHRGMDAIALFGPEKPCC